LQNIEQAANDDRVDVGLDLGENDCVCSFVVVDPRNHKTVNI
jgi:hypothetical protein